MEKDGYFYGRGTQDIKEEDADLVENFIRLHREGWKPKRDIVIALTADEEGGQSNGVDWLLKNRPELMTADFVLNPDAGGVELRRACIAFERFGDFVVRMIAERQEVTEECRVPSGDQRLG